MASTVTTFGIFQSLLVNSVNNDSNLDAATKSSMLVRINELAREVGLVMDFSNVESFGGSVTIDELAKSIEVAVGATGTNRVVWDLMSFTVPLMISGTLTASGFLPGHVGASANGPVADADISMQYRLSTTDTWKTFDRSTRRAAGPCSRHPAGVAMIDLRRAIAERRDGPGAQIAAQIPGAKWVQPKGPTGPSKRDVERIDEGIKGLIRLIKMLRQARQTGKFDGLDDALRRASRPIKDIGTMRYGG
jgi:hypothetical protein